MTPCPGLNIGLLTIWRINNFLTASHLSEKCDFRVLVFFSLWWLLWRVPTHPLPLPRALLHRVLWVRCPLPTVCACLSLSGLCHDDHDHALPTPPSTPQHPTRHSILTHLWGARPAWQPHPAREAGGGGVPPQHPRTHAPRPRQLRTAWAHRQQHRFCFVFIISSYLILVLTQLIHSNYSTFADITNC